MAIIKTTRENQEFLNKLINLARTYGWEGDYLEVSQFVRWCHYFLGTPLIEVDLTPYDSDIEVEFIEDIEHIEGSGVVWNQTLS